MVNCSNVTWFYNAAELYMVKIVKNEKEGYNECKK